MYPIAYNNGKIVFSIGHTKILDSDSLYHNQDSDEITDVIIPDFVEKIKNEIFTSKHVERVILAEGLQEIRDRSFSRNRIMELNLPNTLELIGRHAFSYNLLEELVIPDSVRYIGYYAFEYNNLKKVKLGKSLKTICDHTFLGNAIENLTFSDNILEIGCSNCDYVKVLNLIDIDLSYFKYFTKKLKYRFDNLNTINIKFKHELASSEKIKLNVYMNTIYKNITINTKFIEEQTKEYEKIEDKEINDLLKENTRFFILL